MTEAAAGHRLSGSPETLVHGVSTDSRQINPLDLFVALAGDRFDGHAFLDQAVQRRAAAVLVDERKVPTALPGCGVIAVGNTRVAFGRIAAHYRRGFAIPVIAVVGSNGKTTTKEILATMLREKKTTLASRASFNNDIGVPATLLELDRNHEVAVLEFGTNHPGELTPLLQMAQPKIGVLTSIGREHLEFFGDLNGVIAEEGCVADVLPKDGKLFVNGDAAGLAAISARATAPVVRVGFGAESSWRATEVEMTESGVRFNVMAPHPSFEREFFLPLIGRHQALNALLAIAVAAEMGLAPREVQEGLNKCVPGKMRLQLWHWRGVCILDDSYNANADSMRAALEALRDFPSKGRRIAVLGAMGELGPHAAVAHREVGQYAVAMKADMLVTVGEMAGLIGEAARGGGSTQVFPVADVGAAAETLRALLRADDVVLLKASRSAGLERVGQLLRDENEGQRLKRDAGA
ncbi:MAG: UDP-N-acetylmuramoyl-tripeptide--D-alanyl-D-alanine ligase [Verrucomicrobiota bacterium]